ncbi:MAG: FAD-binding protein [Alphaproteobacteria bacterium]|nr:MAG: FAD-binding protein [Alphaproteobacteria bacterium]
MLKGANAPLRILGGGTCAAVGNPVAGRPLSVAGLAGITLYEPGALTLVARAGTPLAEIEATLAAEGQMLAFEPPDWRRLMGSGGAATIGGTVAMNRSGPRRVAAGAARDMLLGLRFVTGTGSIVKSGGRVMKNVTGYDLARLVAGSHGTLGVITEVALKVLPRPEAAATLVLHGLDDARAVAAMTAALATPWEVSGAAHLPQGPWDGPATLLRLEGRAAALAGRRGKLARHLAAHGEITILDDPDRIAALWADVAAAGPLADRPGDVWRVILRPTDAPAALAAVRPAAHLIDWGGGLVWMLVTPGRDIRPALAGLPGHARLIRAAAETRTRIGAFPPESPDVAALSAGLRARFDPRGILNPGLMG